ncbi:MAG: nuclear transport factor 2 family protein [Coleofasciculus sp. C3-bin4]|nr:nuclear transport factor 2 family protein [Coleofasciculus sp. C3-bin4]
MRNPATSLAKLSQSLTAKAKSRSLDWSLLLFLALGLTVGWAEIAQAEKPETAPPQLKDLLAQIDAAATRRDIKGVVQFYSDNFNNSDGLTRAAMERALTKLWERYPQVNYRTELKDWKAEGNGIVAETVTTITGTQASDATKTTMESRLRSRQRIENQKIVQQNILAERTQLVSGEKPPDVEINLPEQVRVGQDFNFDVIVKEPLGGQLLLGTAVEEPVKPERYASPAKYKLELLPAGGIFKVGKAPLKPTDHWVSAVLIRGDGMTMITQRLQFVDRLSATTTPSK